jgi:DNA-binding response OmpR family regulator
MKTKRFLHGPKKTAKGEQTATTYVSIIHNIYLFSCHFLYFCDNQDRENRFARLNSRARSAFRKNTNIEGLCLEDGPMKTTILIADGQKETLNTLRLYLEREGYSVLEAQNGADTLELVYLHRIDIAVLNISLPGMNGRYLVRKLRDVANVPILLISSSGDTNELHTALRLGADDLIMTPVNANDLIARIRGHLHRARQFSDAKSTEPGIYRFENIELDTDRCEVATGGIPLDLTPTEYKLLRHFMENPGRIFNTHQLYEVGWNDTRFVDDEIIEGCVSRIREKLGDTDGSILRSVPESGYSLGPVSS